VSGKDLGYHRNAIDKLNVSVTPVTFSELPSHKIRFLSRLVADHDYLGKEA
jgi:hypothetical protein